MASIVPRTTLLAGLIAAIGRDPAIREWHSAPSSDTGSTRTDARPIEIGEAPATDKA